MARTQVQKDGVIKASMELALLLFLHGPDIRECQRIQPGQMIRVNHRQQQVLANLNNWTIWTRTPGTLEQNIRRYEDLKCFKK